MLHSIKKEISNDSSSNFFLMLKNVKMQTIVGIFNIYEHDISCSVELCMKKLINLSAGYVSGIREISTFFSPILIFLLFWPQREKTCLRGFANNTSADQPAHPRSLISAFVIHFLQSITSKLAAGETVSLTLLLLHLRP